MRPDSLVGTIALRVPLVAIAVLALLSAPLAAQTLPGTEPLTWEGDLAARMVAGVDRFLLNKIEQSAAKRERHWQRNLDSAAAYQESVEPNRKRLAERLGVRDERREFGGLELLATTSQPALVGRGDGFKAYAVRWPVLRNMYGEGLLLVPDEANRLEIDVVAIPDADQTPEQLAGLADGLAADSQFARRLAEAGCRVVVPTLVSREMQRRAPPGQAGRANLSNREFVHRSAYELGRHLAGYETQKVLAAVDWFERDAAAHDRQATVAAIGYGEGGMLALYAGALDTRIDVVAVCGYFGPRETIWQQPIDRNVFGLLEQFGDAEVASLIAPRPLVIDAVDGPSVDLPSEGGAPATLRPFTGEQATAEVERLRAIVGPLKLADGRSAAENVHLVQPGSGPDAARAASDEALRHLLVEAAGDPRRDSEPDELVRERLSAAHESPRHFREGFSPADRQRRQINEIDEHNQWLLEESPYTRAGFMNIGLTRDDRADGREQAGYEFGRGVCGFRRTVSGGLSPRCGRPLRRSTAAVRRAVARGLRRTGLDRLRSRVGRVSGCVCLRHSLLAEEHPRGRTSAGCGLPTWSGGASARHRHRRSPGVSRFRGEAGRARLYHVLAAELVHRQGRLPHVAA
ncbi:MAG: hypothetical protein R3C99_03665 [Pirellulaceae bacterium]